MPKNLRPLFRWVWVLGMVLLATGCGSTSEPQAEQDAKSLEMDVDVADETGADLVSMAELHAEIARPLAGTEATGDQPIAVWKPDVDRLVSLGTPQRVEDYEISLPVNFRPVDNPNRDRFEQLGIYVAQWMGPAEAGEPGPSFSLTIHPAVSTPRDCEAALHSYLENMKREWPQTEVRDIEHGNIGDMPGVRASYETFPVPDLRIVGRTYFIQDGLRAMMIDVKGVGEEGDEILKLLDTAALTFRSRVE